jgi:hypothetical protein
MSSDGFDLVDWWAVQRLMDKLPEMFRLWVSKHMSCFCGVGRMQLICSFWEHSNCPQCYEEYETTTYVFTCDGDDVLLEWEL